MSEDLKLSVFQNKSKAKTSYPANKAHSRANLFWMKNSGCEFHKCDEKRIYDIADSFMQLQAWRRDQVKELSIVCAAQKLRQQSNFWHERNMTLIKLAFLL